MHELMIFKGHEVEVFEWNGLILFNPYDCGKCLDLEESSTRNHLANMNKKQAILLKNSDVRDKDIRKLNNAGEKFLTESGVYKLIFKSHKPDAEEFQDWVTDEVLPSIRKHSMYATDEMIDKMLDDPDIIYKTLTKLKAEQEKNKQLEAEKLNLQAKIEEDRPKVVLADAITVSDTSILIREFVKILKQNGIDTGEKRFYSWLKSNGYLIKKEGHDCNTPTQKSMDLKLFELKETPLFLDNSYLLILQQKGCFFMP